MYGRVIETADKENLKKYLSENIRRDAQVRTDGWIGYSTDLLKEKSIETLLNNRKSKELCASQS